MGLIATNIGSISYQGRTSRCISLTLYNDFFETEVCIFTVWRNARVVEWDGLENRCTGNCTGGSNPSFSAPARRSFSEGGLLFYQDITSAVALAKAGLCFKVAASLRFLRQPPPHRQIKPSHNDIGETNQENDSGYDHKH